MRSYLALGLAGLENAKTQFRWRLYAHIVTLCAALLAIFLPQEGEYYAALLALVSEVVSWVCHHSALELHALGREAIRRALLEAGLNEKGTAEERAELERRLGRAVANLADRYQPESLREYYSSIEPFGPTRLKEVLRESAFVSGEMYARASRRSLMWTLALLGAALLAALLILPAFGTWLVSAQFTVARLIVLVVAFLPASDELDHLMLWRSAAVAVRSLEHRLGHLNPMTSEQLWMAIADYAAITAAAPPVPSSLFKDDREYLSKLWKERSGSNNV